MRDRARLAEQVAALAQKFDDRDPRLEADRLRQLVVARAAHAAASMDSQPGFAPVSRPSAPFGCRIARTGNASSRHQMTSVTSPNVQIIATPIPFRGRPGMRLHRHSDAEERRDVAVVLKPPYQSDAGTAGQPVALSHFFGQHGYLPDYVDLANNINMHAVFVLGGPLINHRDNVKGLRAIDVAPTIAFLMDIPGPQNARGRILYDLVENTDQLQEITILDISDYHAQLTPLAEASDNLAAPAVNATLRDRWVGLPQEVLRDVRGRVRNEQAGSHDGPE